jgi:hypothetical protein
VGAFIRIGVAGLTVAVQKRFPSREARLSTPRRAFPAQVLIDIDALPDTFA